MVYGSNTHAMKLAVVHEKNRHTMTLVDPYVVHEKNRHAVKLGVVHEKNRHALTPGVVHEKNRHAMTLVGPSLCGL